MEARLRGESHTLEQIPKFHPVPLRKNIYNENSETYKEEVTDFSCVTHSIHVTSVLAKSYQIREQERNHIKKLYGVQGVDLSGDHFISYVNV